ncbi:MAG: MtaA/CmuA family methyltransferase [Candidatus Methanomethylophilaceae archaeon]|nr:MtaA/CmuA family methyltransferase [Candidatus Methanomethylophilaceae archaeon]
MTPRERVLAAMKKESLDRPPAAIFTQSATLGQMDKVGAAWPEAHKDPELMAKLGCAQADVHGFECVRAPFCLTAETERLGGTVAVDKKDASPMIKKHPFHFDPMGGEFDDVNSVLMSPEEFIQGGRPAVAIKAIELMKKSHGEDYAVVAGNTGPFTLTGNLVNTENIIFGIMMCPDEVDKWVTGVNPIVTAYTRALHDAGADVVQCSEPSGSTDMLSPDMFDDAAGKHVRVSLAPRPNEEKFTVLHICGDTTPILDHMAATNVTGISIEEKVDSYKAVELVGGKTVLVGNVGSVMPLFQGNVEEVIAGVKKSMDAGFNVLSSGCGIATATPDENMLAFSRTVKGE